MIRIVAGLNVERKTKKLIEMANDSNKISKGNIVFIDNNERHIYELNHSIRFICTNDFPLDNYREFYGFVCGILSEDHDIEEVYFDGLLKLSHSKIEEIQLLIDKLKIVSDKYNVRFVISISCESNKMPEYLKEYCVA